MEGRCFVGYGTALGFATLLLSAGGFSGFGKWFRCGPFGGPVGGNGEVSQLLFQLGFSAITCAVYVS